MVLIATRKPTYKEDAMQKTSCQSDKPTVSLLGTISGKKKKKTLHYVLQDDILSSGACIRCIPLP